MNILIKFATRGRVDRFNKTIESFIETFSYENNAHILVSLDLSDKDMCDRYNTGTTYLHERVSIEFTKKAGESNKIEAINRDINGHPYKWDMLVNLSDDMEFVVKGWDKKLTDYIDQLGHTDCFLHVNDGYVGDKLPTMSVIGSEYYARFYYIYPPCYYSFSCDAEVMFVSQMLDKWHYFDEVLFRHEHPANNPRYVQYDETYHRASVHASKDIETYFKRMRKLFYVNNPVKIPELLYNELKEKGWLN
jgi:hypothetical protein